MFEDWNTKRKNNCYYPAVSCVQKAIRRGRFDLARIPALVSYRLSDFRFGRRLHTILFEDCGRDWDTVRFMFEHYQQSRKSEEGILAVVKQLCDSVKSKEPNELAWASSELEPADVTPVVEEIRKFIEPWMGFRKLQETAGYGAVLDEFAKFGIVLPEWLSKMMMRCVENGFDLEKQGFFVPFFWQLDLEQGDLGTYDDREPEYLDATFEDMFLMSGIDTHTGMGKVIETKWKKDGVLSKTETELHWLMWYFNSSVLKRVKKIDYEGAVEIDWATRSREFLTRPGDFELFELHTHELNQFRRWALRKMGEDFVTACREVAEE